MEENDKPLGAPQTNSSEEQIHSTPPPKRKLNWKGFLIAVVVVAFIEILAVSALRSGDPQIVPPVTPTKSQPSPTQQAVASPSVLPSQTASPKLSCRPRPACLDANPRCLIAETADMCPPTGQTTLCTQDAKQCSDGTWVGRSGPKCEFKCP